MCVCVRACVRVCVCMHACMCVSVSMSWGVKEKHQTDRLNLKQSDADNSIIDCFCTRTHTHTVGRLQSAHSMTVQRSLVWEA